MSARAQIEPSPSIEEQSAQSRREPQVARWSLACRVAFRFCFVYFGLYCLATQILGGLFPIPKVDVPDLSTLWPMRPAILWTAAHILRIPHPLAYADTGSGDRAFDWVLVFCQLAVAALATGIWSILDRRRENYVTLYKWFRLFLRFAMASTMLTYGLDKFIPVQMPYPYLTRLLEPFGNFSPMGVLWSFIGASPAYETFTGCAEMLGGLLLIIPRTTMLGALVCMADAVHIFTLNMTYDVPVKLLSFHLLLMALFLLAPDASRLADFFLWNRRVEPSTQPQLFATRRANRIILIAQIVLGVWLVGVNAYTAWSGWKTYGGGRTKSALYGIWNVDQFAVDGQLRSPLLGDYARWRRAIFDFTDRMTFQRMDDSFARFGASINVGAKTLALTKDGDKNWKANFQFERAAQDQLALDGDMDGHRIHMRLQLVDRNKLLLVNRGVHWVQENPFNR
jgi:uncharacterized membrane protein YphA (DoxX/SURF4 family)